MAFKIEVCCFSSCLLFLAYVFPLQRSKYESVNEEEIIEANMVEERQRKLLALYLLNFFKKTKRYKY